MQKFSAIMQIVDRLTGQDIAKCREYMRLCIVSAGLADALAAIARRRDAVPLAELYDDVVAAGSAFASVLAKNRDLVTYLLNSTVKYLLEFDEGRGEAKHVVLRGLDPIAVTKEGLLLMAAHLDTARAFLGCII